MPPTTWWLTLEEWKNLTAAIASLVTAIGLIVGAIWAYRRFRRTSESRPKVLVRLEPTWPPSSSDQRADGQHVVLVKVTVENEGGKRWVLVPEVPNAPTRTSYLAYWVMTPSRLPVTEPTDSSGAFIDWRRSPDPETADLLVDPIQLSPRETWDLVAAVVVPSDALAIRAGIYLEVTRQRVGKHRFGRSKGTLRELSSDLTKYLTLERYAIVVRPKEDHGDTTGHPGLSDRQAQGQPHQPAPAAQRAAPGGRRAAARARGLAQGRPRLL